MPDETWVDIAGQSVRLSNLNKIFYGAIGFTKAQVIDYYIRIAPVLLPHLTGRPLTMKRYPNGANGKYFYQKECPASRPTWMQIAPVWSESNRNHTHFCLVNDLPSLVWAANLAALELHTSLSLATNVLQPTAMVFDLDPGAPATILDCAKIALIIRTFLQSQGLDCFPKTSGSKGLQIYVPVNTTIEYIQTKKYAHAVARLLEKEHPSIIVSNMRKSLRNGKVFIDWSQNDDHKTTVCVYSLRAGTSPGVSTPLAWNEIEDTVRRKDMNLLSFSPSDVIDRINRLGDLFAPVLTLKQKIIPNKILS